MVDSELEQPLHRRFWSGMVMLLGESDHFRVDSLRVGGAQEMVTPLDDNQPGSRTSCELLNLMFGCVDCEYQIMRTLE
jgi:hypothetical protein